MHVSRYLFGKEKQISLEVKEERKVSCLKIFLVDLFGIQYLFIILLISLTVNNSENVVKKWCMLKSSQRRAPFFFKMKEGCKDHCVKILIFC